MNNIRKNIELINESISVACSKTHKCHEEIRLIAVSKTHTVHEIKNAYNCGLRDFGENRVQELIEKSDKLPNDIKWHMIGHLQTNKVKYIAPFIHMIHSVDSIKLAKEIDKEAAKNNRCIPILIEVNINSEDSKFGIKENEIVDILIEISKFSNIKIKGLMTVAPFTENTDDIRYCFSKLYELYLDINSKKLDNIDMNVLSMGMSGDFEIAIEEGSNCVRIGTSLFGRRNYD